MLTRSSAHHLTAISYTLKVSSRSKSVRLKMSPYDGLVVVVPPGFDKAKVPSIVEGRREWILKVQKKFEKHRAEEVAPAETTLPGSITLAGIGESWRVEYRYDPLRPGIYVRELDGNVLDLSGGVDNRALCIAAIENWLKWRAKQRMTQQLMQLAAEQRFTITGVTVKKQKSRWGSCSSRGNINLNLKLIFLPPELVRYIMIHELCHTLHMNHSTRYWETVARYDPDWKEHDRQMRHAWKFVPAWFAISDKG
jgi:predicted metal-dependent hydrolase